MRIIGMCGSKGVGKNFVTDQISDEIELTNNKYHIHIAAYADPFKKFLSEAFGIDEKLLYGSDKDKNTKTQYSWANIPEHIRAKFNNPSGNLTVREFMQVFGTEICRDMFDQNIWVNAMERKIVKAKNQWGETPNVYFLITDVRFPHEVSLVKKHGGQIWKVDGPQRGDDFAKKDGHSSETSLHDGVQYDKIILNGWEDTAETIRAKVREALKS